MEPTSVEHDGPPATLVDLNPILGLAYTLSYLEVRQMAHMATISSKGQLVIPAALRKKYRLKAGARVSVSEVDGEIRIIPNPFDEILALRGKYSQYPLEHDLLEERRKWDERLEAM